jgi:phytoene synthase
MSDSYEADLAACRETLRAGSRSFDAAARLLPRAVRDPAIALYAFCRDADDVIDGDAHGAGGLGWLRERLSLAYAGRPVDLAADRAFARIVSRYAIPRALPEALLEGFVWDLEGRRYADLPALRAYAVRVAGTVGAMMAVLMGVRDPARLAAAVDLGVAMQLSNIARDVGEDARAGRLYLPLRWLEESGIDPDAFLADPGHGPALAGVVRRLLAAADTHYRRARPGIARLPVGCRFGIAAASLLYAEIGREVARRNHDSVSGRAMVSGRRKLGALVFGLAGTVLPVTRLSTRPVPEGAFLIDAVARPVPGDPAPHAPPRHAPSRREPRRQAATSWWNLPERALWVIDLFGRLEQRQRVRT